MASFASFSYRITILIIAPIFIPYTSSASSPNRGRNTDFTTMFAFGDSFTDTGNTKSSTGPNGFMHVSSPPYGMTYFHRPTNRYSDGRLVIDFVAEALSMPHLPPYLHAKGAESRGINFAVAGATAINYSFFVRNNITLDITPHSILSELAWFRQFLKRKGGQDMKLPECKKLMKDSLFWIGEIGVNDVAYNLGLTVSNTLIQKKSIDSITLFLKELLDMGAKYVVVQGAPPAGCLPMTLTLASPDDRDAIGCVASSNNQSSHHNSQLKVRMNYLRRQYPHAIISYADYFSAYHTIIINAKKYGFTEPFMACCGTGGQPYNFNIVSTCGAPESSKACADPAQYINWDGVHLTEAMYKIIADMFLHGGYTQPSFDFLLSNRRREE